MPSQLNYIWEKYYKATQTLGSSDDPLRNRLSNAYLSHAVHAYPPTGGVPDDLAERIRELHRRLTEAPDPSGIGTVRASVELLGAEQLREFAQEIIDIAFSARRALTEQHG